VTDKDIEEGAAALELALSDVYTATNLVHMV